MKIIIKRNKIIICLVVFGAYFNLSSTTLFIDRPDSNIIETWLSEQDSIIGTWISEKDSNWKLVFTG